MITDTTPVWKVGSRWDTHGHWSASILDVFRRHKIVFVGTLSNRFRLIQINDLIAIADGYRVVAFGVVKTTPKPVSEMRINFSKEELGRFDLHDDVVGCEVDITEIDPKRPLSMRVRSAVCRVNRDAHTFRHYYQQLHQTYQIDQKFQIQARSCTLMAAGNQDHSNVLWKDNLTFRIPIYQRPYSWGESQAGKLFTDLISGYCGLHGKAQGEPMFIGTMQLSDRLEISSSDNHYLHEVIDGQQRLSTIILILKMLRDRYSNNHLLASLKFSQLLQTEVNEEEQQAYLDEILEKTDTTTDDFKANSESTLNPYIKVMPCLIQVLSDALTMETSSEEDDDDGASRAFDADGFISYVLHSIYFVVIETRASLSKTLQIFDAINTAGMDLNGGDIFKIRFYDYLKPPTESGKETFRQISQLYQKIDQQNNTIGRRVSSIEDILSLYRHQLIARYGLRGDLHRKIGSTRFFEQLFDVLQGINTFPHFNDKKVDSVAVTIKEIGDLIETRYQWENMIRQMGVEPRCMLELIWWSRYSRYADLTILFLHRFQCNQEQLEQFTIALSKFLIYYSCIKRKALLQIHSKMYELYSRMFIDGVNRFAKAQDVIEQIKKWIIDELKPMQTFFETECFAWNTMAKRLICRLSALLTELEFDKGQDTHKMVQMLFHTDIDIEHIESFNHKDLTQRQNIQKQWGDWLHRIGNLMVLESTINKSISNEGYIDTKLPNYETSQFQIVKQHAKTYKKWNLEECNKRHQFEVKKLMNYFSQQ